MKSILVQEFILKISKYFTEPSDIYSNPFFSVLSNFIEIRSPGKSSNSSLQAYPLDKTKGSDSYSTAWQASLINGLSSFMAGRFKQEVLSMGIDQLFRQIVTNKEDSLIVAALFPTTFKQIVEKHCTGFKQIFNITFIFVFEPYE
jgi:hypothetical protein